MSDKAWRYLRQALAFHDSAETDYRYSKTVLETIMQHQRAPPPPWLISSLEVGGPWLFTSYQTCLMLKTQTHHHEFLIRIHLRYGNILRAIEHTLSLIRKVAFLRFCEGMYLSQKLTGGIPLGSRTTKKCRVDVVAVRHNRSSPNRGGGTGRCAVAIGSAENGNISAYEACRKAQQFRSVMASL